MAYCLPQTTYTADQESALAVEVTKLPSGDIVTTFLEDYGAMRAANRACIASQGTKTK